MPTGVFAVVVIVRVAPGPPGVRVIVFNLATGQFVVQDVPVMVGVASATVPENPFRPTAVMVLVRVCPGWKRRVVGLAGTLKSCTSSDDVPEFPECIASLGE